MRHSAELFDNSVADRAQSMYVAANQRIRIGGSKMTVMTARAERPIVESEAPHGKHPRTCEETGACDNSVITHVMMLSMEDIQLATFKSQETFEAVGNLIPIV